MWNLIIAKMWTFENLKIKKLDCRLKNGKI